MRILVISDPHISVPPTLYGGIERIVHGYCSEFQQRGHHVDLIAAPGSRSYGGSTFFHQPHGSSYLSRAQRKLQFQVLSVKAAARCDVIFSCSRVDYLESLLRLRRPLLHLFQNPIHHYEVAYLLRRSHDRLRLAGISHHQLSLAFLEDSAHLLPNFVDCSTFRPAPSSVRTGLLFLGRLTANKGVDTAIDIARATRTPLVLAGNVPADHVSRQFFARSIKPHIDDDLIRYVGPVNDAQKIALMSQSKACLFPIRWAEPFGIVMAEALACGTPVIASRCASTPEVVSSGITGFLCDSLAEMVEAVHRIDTIDPAQCRHAAESKFDSIVAANRCLDLLSSI